MESGDSDIKIHLFAFNIILYKHYTECFCGCKSDRLLVARQVQVSHSWS